MTAAAKPPFKEYLENGVTLAYAVPFRFNQPGHIAAQRIAVDGTVTVLAYGVDYSVSGGTTDSGGTLTVATAGAVGVRLQIRRATPRDQSMNYATSDTFPAESHEGALDKAMLIDQEQDEAIGEIHGRAIMVPVGELADELPKIDTLKGRLLGVDLDGRWYGSFGEGADANLRSDLAENGDALNAYNPGGAGSVPTSARARLQRDVWAEDYFAGLSPGDNYQPAFDRAMNVARARGRSRIITETMIDTKSTIQLRSGMSIEGDGAHYRWDNDLGANVYEGAWIRNSTPGGGPVLRFGSMQDSRLSGVGIFCGEQPNTVAISIGSDNNPSTQALYFERFIVVGAALAVKWGDSNAASPLEQCDDISFRDFSFHSCIDGFRVDANNVADTSLIERGKFYQMQGVCVDLLNCGILRISECQAGLLYAASRMFRIAGQAPDQLIIQLCQSEGLGGKMIEIDGNNDQGSTHLIGCVINQPVECDGVLRVTSTGCYINTTIDLDGYVRWDSENDVWDGPKEIPQITTANGARFRAKAMRDADSFNGRWLPRGFEFDNDPTAGAFLNSIAVRAGIYGRTFIPSIADFYYPGFYVLPTADNGFAYKVTVAASASGVEPSWPTTIGDTVVSGGVTFQCVGASALVKGVGEVEA